MNKKEKKIAQLKKQISNYTKKCDNSKRCSTIWKYQILIEELEEKLILLELK